METLAQAAARHGMSVEQWEMIGSAERSTREREYKGPVARRVRPCDVVFTMTPEQTAEVYAIADRDARTTKYREIKQVWMDTR